MRAVEADRQISIENPLRGAPRIHSELLKLGSFSTTVLSESREAKKEWRPLSSFPPPTFRKEIVAVQAKRVKGQADVRFASKADILRCGSDVRFTPNSGH
jgi:hypothetical protein